MGDDARDWTPDNEADPAALFLSYCDAAFWSMVWKSRVEKLAELDGQRWPENQAAEDATARRLILVNAALDAAEWGRATDLLLPVAAPAWAYYPGEDERMLAFRPESCRGTSGAWDRLFQYRLAQLPEDLIHLVKQRR